MGITDYITRPFDSVIVKKRVQNTLELYANQKRLINVVVDQVYEKEENNDIMLRILSNVLGSRNSESSEHILHIRTATEMMLRQLLKTTDAYHLDCLISIFSFQIIIGFSKKFFQYIPVELCIIDNQYFLSFIHIFYFLYSCVL